jgi:hypothetical protein
MYCSNALASNLPFSSRKPGSASTSCSISRVVTWSPRSSGREREQRALDQLARGEVVERLPHRARVVAVAELGLDRRSRRSRTRSNSGTPNSTGPTFTTWSRGTNFEGPWSPGTRRNTVPMPAIKIAV